MERKKVYELIDGERECQEALPANRTVQEVCWYLCKMHGTQRNKTKIRKDKRMDKRMIVPVNDYVLVEVIVNSDMVGGILVVDTSGLKKAKVIAVGEGRVDNGVRVPVCVKAGDVVLINALGYVAEDYMLIGEGNIIARVE